MSIAIGIDLVCVDEVGAAIETHGERYLRRVYTDQEQRECARDARRLAERFAAKEATMKALKRSDESLPWRSIGVRVSPDGQAEIELGGEAARLAGVRGVKELSVGLGHAGRTAIAVVVGEGPR